MLLHQHRNTKVKLGKSDPFKNHASPFVVLLGRQDASADQLPQQEAHVLPGDGAALQSGLDSVPHKQIQYGCAVKLLHTLHRLLQDTQRAAVTTGTCVKVYSVHLSYINSSTQCEQQ